MIFNSVLAVTTALPVALAGALGSRSTKIIGGEDAQPGDFDSIVAILYDDSKGVITCGGSLLNANTIVTAAHCSNGGSVPKFHVRVGSLDFTTGGQLLDVDSIIIHPMYDMVTYEYDIAVWKLATPVEPADNISYAILPELGFDPPAGSEVSMAGWGYINLLGFADNQLQKVSNVIVDREECNEDYVSENHSVTGTMICAASAEAGLHNHCYGDSGGPVVNSEGVLVGIISWAKLCALPKFPGVNANVGSLVDFIKANL